MAKNGSISSSKGYYDNYCILNPGYTDYTIWKTEGEMKWWIKSTDTARGIITIEWSLKVKNIVNEPMVLYLMVVNIESKVMFMIFHQEILKQAELLQFPVTVVETLEIL